MTSGILILTFIHFIQIGVSYHIRKYNNIDQLFATRPSTHLFQGPDCNSNTGSNDVFGAEFLGESLPGWVADTETEYTNYKGETFRTITPEKREVALAEFDRLRLTFVLDSMCVSFLGFCSVWVFGTLTDARGYALGALLGTAYSILLTRYVEGIGNDSRRSNLFGSLRFVPVILLVLLYSRNKTTISFIPEFVGFFSYQLGSLLQIFNKDAYGEMERVEKAIRVTENERKDK